MGLAVVNFTKSTGAAPASQSIAHGLGETPKGVIFIGVAKISTGFTVHFLQAFGFSDGTGEGCVSWACQDNVNPTNNARGLSATKCIVFIDYDGTILAEADCTGFDGTNVNLSWSTNNASAYQITMIVFSGATVSSKVINWTSPTSTGNKAVTGVGFQPDLVINCGVNQTALGNSASALISLGLVDQNGNQFALSITDLDAQGSTDSYKALYQKSHHTVGVGITSEIANYVSFDSDGFTNNFTAVTGTARQIVSFCIRGLGMKVGSFDKSTGAAPASQAVTGVGFQPAVLLFMHSCQTIFGSIAAHTQMGLGAADADTEFATHANSEDAQNPSDVDGLVKTDKCIVVAANHTQTIDAEADLTSLDADGFTLNWPTNNATAYKIVYLALTDSVQKSVSDSGTLVESLIFPAKDIWLNETLTLNEILFYFTKTDTITLVESVSFPVKSIWLNETITAIDTQAIIFALTDTINFADTVTIANLIELSEQLNLNENIVLAISLALTETVNLTEKLARILNLTDPITVAEVLSMLLEKPFTDSASLGESISITKQQTVIYEEPDVLFAARPIKRYYVIEKPKKLN